MDREINILNYLPDFLKEFREFRELAAAENPELILIWRLLEDVLNDQFVADATENGIKRWETILKIFPKGSDSLEVRKFRILARLNEKLPYTRRTLESQLDALCGELGYSVELRNDEYTLVVRVALAEKGKFDEVSSLLKRTVPANIIIDLSLLYNTHAVLSRYTNEQLAAYTHEQLRSEVLN